MQDQYWFFIIEKKLTSVSKGQPEKPEKSTQESSPNTTDTR